MKQKKVLSLLLAVAMAFSLTVPAVAAEGDAAGTESGKIVILHTNDVHCGIDQAKNDAGEVTNIGYAGVAAYKAAMEAAYGAENVTITATVDHKTRGQFDKYRVRKEGERDGEEEDDE